MAAGHDANIHDDHGHDAPLQAHPDHDTHVHGGHAAADDHGHDSHDAHGSTGDAWVIPPLVVGLVIGIAVAVFFGLQSAAAAFN